MIITKKDADGRVIAYAEFRVVNEKGTEDADGAYVWINDVWVHEAYRRRNAFNAILKEFLSSCQKRFWWVRFIYWQRGKYQDRMSLYSRDKILRRTADGKTERAGLHASSNSGASANTATI